MIVGAVRPRALEREVLRGLQIENLYRLEILTAIKMVVIVRTTRSGAFAMGFSYASRTSTQAAPYLNGSKNLVFSRNTYCVPSTAEQYWYSNAMLY